MLSHRELTTSDRKNRSFASQKIEILRPVTFKAPVEPCSRIIFIHPPKTGGTNLCFIVDALSKINSLFKSTRFPVPRITGQSPGLITENWIGGLKSVEDAMQINPHACDGWNFISGHFPFGLHEFLDGPAKYIVLIRHPIERALSSTNFDYQRGYITKEDAQAYLLSAEIDNPQTRLLAGKAFMSSSCNDETLEIAKSNIQKHFLLAGVTEDTNSFIQILGSIQNWGPLALPRNQVTGDKVIAQLDTEIVDKLANKHQYDLRLYDWVKEQWQLWKENYIGTVQDISARTILCVTSDFANTRSPKPMTELEVDRYNQTLTEELIEISQNHSELKKGIISSNFVPGFFGLKNQSGDPMELSVGRQFRGYS
jgi:hypothetical protein